MIEKSTLRKVLSVFFENPSRQFHLRQLSRMTNLSMPTIILTTNILAKNQLIIKNKSKVLTIVMANRDFVTFSRYKQVYNLEKIYDSDIVDYLSKAYNHPKAIILFGSYARGEDTEKSDIDIAIITSKRITDDYAKFEKFLNRNISVHEINENEISNEFRKNLANGIVLGGSW